MGRNCVTDDAHDRWPKAVSYPNVVGVIRFKLHEAAIQNVCIIFRTEEFLQRINN